MELCKTKPQNDNKLFLSIITKQAQIYYENSFHTRIQLTTTQMNLTLD